MPNRFLTPADRSTTIRWVLRFTLIAMCIGQSWWLAEVQETPLVSWLHSPSDIGGLDLSEAFALRAQSVLAGLLMLAAVVSCFRSNALLLWSVSLVQLLIAVAMWRMQSGFQFVAPWLPFWLTDLLPLATHAGRIAAPLALWLCDSREFETSASWELIARWGTALAFLGHGMEALWMSPQFVDLILHSANRWNLVVAESTARALLAGIGATDLLLAAILVTKRWRLAAMYAAAWGFATACSRITAYGLEFGWYETLIRAAHFGLPAALALYWRLRSPPAPTPTENSPSPN